MERFWQGHEEVHTYTHSQKSNCCQHDEASPEDQLGGGETATLQLPDHMSTLRLCAPITVPGVQRHEAVH